jgi:hypothetical protein
LDSQNEGKISKDWLKMNHIFFSSLTTTRVIFSSFTTLQVSQQHCCCSVVDRCLQLSVDRSMSLTEDGLSLTSPKPFNSFNWTHWSLLLLLFEQFVLAHCCGFLYKSHVWNLQQKMILQKMLCLHHPQN